MNSPGASHGPLRLLADDLTGALDSGAQFTARHGPLDVAFRREDALRPGALAFDCGTRDQSASVARETARALAGYFSGAGLAMRKIDTLIRGHSLEEAALSFRLGGFRSAVFAPAYPAQGRVMRNGRQWLLDPSGPVDVAGDLGARFAPLGVDVRYANAPESLTGAGFFLCDAASAADLDAIVTAGHRLDGPVLWCGAAGLAAALGGGAQRAQLPAAPVLLIVGSPNARSRAQLEAVKARWPRSSTRVTDTTNAEPPVFTDGLAVLDFAFDGMAAADIAAAIQTAIDMRLARLTPPGVLYVTGGETLRATAEILGASGLRVTGDVAEGIPASCLIGGRWSDIPVVSKSGAFGAPDTLEALISASLRAASPTGPARAAASGDIR